MMKIYLFRHPETLRPPRTLVGQMDFGLSAKGYKDARWWAERFPLFKSRKIYCSDLIRSKAMANILSEGRGQVVVVPEFNEINLGSWDGLTIDKIESLFPGQWEERGRNIEIYTPEKGESFRDLSNRVLPIFEWVTQDGEDIVIVGHAGVNRVILCNVLRLSMDNMFCLKMDYASLNIISKNNGHFQVEVMNFTPDLCNSLTNISSSSERY